MLCISHKHLNTIQTYAEADYPYECCGFLAGRTNYAGMLTITRVVPSPNTQRNSTSTLGKDRFEVDPQTRFDLMRDLHNTDEYIIGHYHSHPDHPATPSQVDLDMAFEPELLWLITSVQKGIAEDTKAWKLNRATQDISPVELLLQTFKG